MAQYLSTTSWKTIFLLAGLQWILAGAGLLAIGVSASVASPAFPFEAGQSLDAGVAAPPLDRARVQGGARLTQLDELMETLMTARSRLDELSRLTEQAAAKSSELDGLRARERNMLAEVQALHADRRELRDARDAALARMEDLAEAFEQAALISQRLGQQLSAEHQRNLELSGQNEEVVAELMSLRSAGALVEGKIARLRDQLADAEQRLAAAVEVRTNSEAKLVVLQERCSGDEQKILELQTQISTLEERLKEKDAALESVAFLRSERDEFRYRLAAIEAELRSDEEEKDRLSAELDVFRSAAQTATDLARQHLLTVEAKIKELNEAASAAKGLDVLRGPKLEPASEPGYKDKLSDALPQFAIRDRKR
jgi:chromosome segregation ATPase